MGDLSGIGKMLVFGGLLLLIIGGLFLLLGKLFNVGRLPGDILIQRGNVTFFFPIATGIIISIILTVLLNIFFSR
ncbi:hypothetical protein GGQ84_001434 [Desulfitispora alkaliphila]|uniref:DUF2905 domain-containing protein n=1 Tax=Desulfitispora alkaliphila TaxID=622674 RepID=UPI003D1B6231